MSSDSTHKYCDDHPFQKMTLLLNRYVCDICDPPLNLYLEREPKPRPTAPIFRRRSPLTRDHDPDCLCAFCQAYNP